MTLQRYTAILALIIGLTIAGKTPAQPQNRLGTIVSTMNAEGYTYVEMNLDGSTVWFAAPAVELKVGAQIVAPAGMPMKNFHSKSLDRTFDIIYFVDSIGPRAVEATTALPAGHPPIQSAAGPASAPTAYDFSGIKTPEGGKTIVEIYQESEKLAGEIILVRGIAVKVSNGIMGKNWIHLQDGTGAGTANDLTVTTTNTVSVGTPVTVRGTLATDLDFGFGYQYAVLLQDAEITATDD